MKLVEATDDYANQNANREDLVNGIYGTLQQYSEKDKLSLIGGKQLGAKSLYVNFNQHTDPSTISFSVTVNGAEVKANANPDALNGYILRFPDHLTAGTYSVKVSSSQSEVSNSSVQVKVQEEYPVGIQMTGSDTLPSSEQAIIPFEVKNQFGEAMDYPSSELKLYSSEKSALINDDLQAIVMDTTSYKYDFDLIHVYLYLDASPGISVTKMFKVGQASIASEVRNVTIRNAKGNAVSSLTQGQSYYMNFDVFDQYGTPISLKSLAAAKVTATVSDTDLLTAGPIQAAASSDEADFTIPLIVRYPEKDTDVTVALTMEGQNRSTYTIRIAGVPKSVTSPNPPVVTPEVPRLSEVTHQTTAGGQIFATSSQKGFVYLLPGGPEANSTIESIMNRSSEEGGLAVAAEAGVPLSLSTENLQHGEYVLYAVNPDTGLISEPALVTLTPAPADTSAPVITGVQDTEFLSTETKELKATSSEDGFLYLVQANVGVLGSPTLEMLDLYATGSGLKVEVSAGEEATITVEAGSFIPGYYTFFAVDESGNISTAAGTIIVR
ncbi:hypothetical protein PghCCS26_14460 [Paenibacillus glycanilyticus]|uniref:Cadherin-like beta sandwich domain-containing protein n=1 Tax=Paenibacillus glycanilyticus TaxID=126569 RepID=A0ABQ6NIE5_9BACL|nr:hypothetical protein [Paenibacillus glycanilyticus]GMK44318.1 hypothetical protein PghCCS26_14460 [Paenibacillus glycanilyticus]